MPQRLASTLKQRLPLSIVYYPQMATSLNPNQVFCCQSKDKQPMEIEPHSDGLGEKRADSLAVNQALPAKLALPLPQSVKHGMDDDLNLWKCSIVIVGAATTIGVRQTLYLIAFENVAFYDVILKQQSSIRYDKRKRLLVDLVFISKQYCYDFETALHKYLDGFSHQLNSKLSLSVESMDLVRFKTQSDTQLQRVYFNHYTPSDTDVSTQTYLARLNDHSIVDINTHLFAFQRIEGETGFSQTFYRPDKCHLLDKTRCKGEFERYKENENNIIVLSGDFHSLLDGINGDIPGILLAFKLESDMSNTETNRFAVEIFIEFYNSWLSEVYSPRLKPDSQRLSELVWVTKLWVENVEDFQFCLDSKTEWTKEQWRENGRSEFNYLSFLASEGIGKRKME
ncbi:hypothetical protein BDR26DRAFT_872034 [Obelidium mucronatum]|nr:hypothetical protein BDR26DRAFT_872034 [Obelidium mucronatum]